MQQIMQCVHFMKFVNFPVLATPSGVLLARGQKIKLQLKPEESKVTLPCAVSHPEVHVHLYKVN